MAKSFFNQGDNRVDYGEMLLPEIGYEVAFAVGLMELEIISGILASVALWVRPFVNMMDRNQPQGMSSFAFRANELIRVLRMVSSRSSSVKKYVSTAFLKKWQGATSVFANMDLSHISTSCSA